MDNKDEKTFTDLFSSFKDEINLQTNDNELSNEINLQTNDNELSNEINSKDLSSTLTFDNLFEQISNEKQISTNEQNSIITEESLSKDNVDEVFSTKTEENNVLFHDNNNYSDKNSTSMLTLNDNIPKEEIIIETTVEQNPLFETFDKITDDVSVNNPFFTDSVIENSSSDIEIAESLQSDKIAEDNIFFQDNKIDSNMNSVTISSSNDNMPEEETNIEPSVDANPFFNKVDKVMDESSINNPFFVENVIEKSTIEPTLSQDNTDNSINSFIEPKEEKNVQTETVITSPFFEEEKKTEENPFFQNQLNLIENKIPDSPKGNIDTTKSKHFNVKVVKKKEPLIKLILGVLSYALFIWLLLIGITLLVYVLDIKIRAAKGDYSSPTFNAYVVLTGSMLPEIQVYDVVVTKKVYDQKLKEGDVITFASADTRFLDTIITHRIIKKNPPNGNEGYTFQTQGDNNNVADNALVPENRIFGKVILKIPKLGYLQDFLASRGGWIIVILIPCLTVISYDTVKLVKGLKRKKYKNITVQK